MNTKLSIAIIVSFLVSGCVADITDTDEASGGNGGAGGATSSSTSTSSNNGGNGGATTSSSTTGGDCTDPCATTSSTGTSTSTTGSSGNTSSSTGSGNGSSTSSGGNGSCLETVTYEIIANASDAMSLRLEGADVSYNVQLQDGIFDPAAGEPVSAGWQIIPPGEKYANWASWTYIGCKDGSFRFNVRGWSSVPHQGAPNNDAYACTLYWINGLSPAVTVKRDGTVISYQNNLKNAAPGPDGQQYTADDDGRSCQANGH